jgi:uncharacterized membrane protein YoaK (UPF0700 family)
LQNAIITKASGAVIRTTHVTGLSTDIGIELGKMFYYNHQPIHGMVVRANRVKLKLHTLLVGCFFIGGVAGAFGYKHIGFSASILPSVLLALLAAGPILHDMRVRWRYHRLNA